MTELTDAAMRGRVLELRGDRTAPRRAREWVRATAAAGIDPPFDADSEFNMLLCTSELVNAALLAGATSLTLRFTAQPDCVQISVADDTPVPRGRSDVTVAQRQCFRIIQRLSRRSGVDPRDTGRLAWAEFGRPGGPR